ncbi:protein CHLORORESPIRATORY REDUCTION 6, chloroplastic [Iris pallida]|uniref:Protein CHLORORESPIRATORY REDUCTION 6, chloroplastic n=1 Tax=Iris pallida TaxID=29817 RepID=A0AAX6GLK2_IRIPA|nr:protein CHLORORESPIRATORY REDUCTION 6, chloroplastic [Iris pallida]
MALTSTSTSTSTTNIFSLASSQWKRKSPSSPSANVCCKRISSPTALSSAISGPNHRGHGDVSTSVAFNPSGTSTSLSPTTMKIARKFLLRLPQPKAALKSYSTMKL